MIWYFSGYAQIMWYLSVHILKHTQTHIYRYWNSLRGWHSFTYFCKCLYKKVQSCICARDALCVCWGRGVDWHGFKWAGDQRRTVSRAAASPCLSVSDTGNFVSVLMRTWQNTRVHFSLSVHNMCIYMLQRSLCAHVCVHTCYLCVYTKVCVWEPSGGWKWWRSPESCDGLAGRPCVCLARYMKRNGFSMRGGWCQPMPSLCQPRPACAACCHVGDVGTEWIFKTNSSKNPGGDIEEMVLLFISYI